jgi:hypothetical protein
MRIITDFKARFPTLISVLTTVAVLGTIGGIAAYEVRANADSCCYPGSPCCHPGSPCCNHAHASR